MDQVRNLAHVRELVRKRLHQFGEQADVISADAARADTLPFEPVSADSVPAETMLIRNGFFCGRRFRHGGFEAVWFMEENQIKFFDRDGGLLEVLAVQPVSDAASPNHREAA